MTPTFFFLQMFFFLHHVQPGVPRIGVFSRYQFYVAVVDGSFQQTFAPPHQMAIHRRGIVLVLRPAS